METKSNEVKVSIMYFKRSKDVNHPGIADKRVYTTVLHCPFWQVIKRIQNANPVDVIMWKWLEFSWPDDVVVIAECNGKKYRYHWYDIKYSNDVTVVEFDDPYRSGDSHRRDASEYFWSK